jgi:hypothetical protein
MTWRKNFWREIHEITETGSGRAELAKKLTSMGHKVALVEVKGLFLGRVKLFVVIHAQVCYGLGLKEGLMDVQLFGRYIELFKGLQLFS